MTSPSATPDRYPYQNEPIWSRSEKALARKAFDAALGRELHEVIQEAKKMASQIQQSFLPTCHGLLDERSCRLCVGFRLKPKYR